jgi:hypothetical protein
VVGWWVVDNARLGVDDGIVRESNAAGETRACASELSNLLRVQELDVGTHSTKNSIPAYFNHCDVRVQQNA